MTSPEVLSAYIEKLRHPLKEIRERALCLLAAKLQLGWKFEDELSSTRDLLDCLLTWFHVEQPMLQCEVLQLLLVTIKTKSGAYIVKEFGLKKILSDLSRVRSKIQPTAMQWYEDLMETLRFINTMESDTNVAIPPLSLPSVPSSVSDAESCNGYYNIESHLQSSDENSTSNGDSENNTAKRHYNGIRVFLFPWVDLCPSEAKTIYLVEDALRLVKSTRRCCRFIRDVFLRDFPAEIFLNRPTIVKSLLSVAEGEQGSRPWEALNVLLCITQSLHARLSQLSSLNFVHEVDLVKDDNKCLDTNMAAELENIVFGAEATTIKEDALAAIKQLPAPIYALDTMNCVLSIMTRSIVLLDSDEKCEYLDLRDLNTCLNLVVALTDLVLSCVDESFWISEHNSKMHRDIAHKSCMVMRLLGDLLTKYRNSFQRDPQKSHHRVSWIRLISIAEILLQWSRLSALPPSSLVQAVQSAQLDPAIDLLYPELGKRITGIMQNIKTTVDQDHKNKYKELKKLTDSMKSAVQFMKNQNSCRNSKTVLICIKNALPCLEVHLSEVFVEDVASIILQKSKVMSFDDSDWSLARSIALNFMAHKIDWVQIKFYKMLEEMVANTMVGDEREQVENEKCLNLLCDVGVLTEICCHGLSSSLKEVQHSASEIMQYLLRGRLVVSESCWWRLLASLLPILPLLHAYAAHDTQIGQAICKTLELDIAECMGISLPEVIWGLTRLMFVKCPSVQFDAALSLCKLMDDEKYLPPKESLRSDVLINALKNVEVSDFNRESSSSPSKLIQSTGLMQIMDVLKQDIMLDEHGADYIARTTTPILEASLRRSTLQQLAVLLRHPEMYETFINCDGVKLIVAILRMSLAVEDYLAFPECAISCVSALNSVSYVCRHELAKIPDLALLLFRTILIFPSNESLVTMASQVLCVLSWSGFLLQELAATRRRVPSLPYCVTQRTSMPFVVNSYWTLSSNAERSSVEWLMTEEEWRVAIRVRWWCAYEGCSQVVRNMNLAPQNQTHMNLPLSLRLSTSDVLCLRNACVITSVTKALLALENATSHQQVVDAVNIMESYISVIRLSAVNSQDLSSLPWHSIRRFLCAPPASCRDVSLLTNLLRFILAYMKNSKEASDGDITTWIKPYFIGNDITIISLLSKNQIYPQQTSQEDIEVTQLQIQIVKVLLRCIARLEFCDDYDSNRMESLLKILISCLEKIDLRNFHMLGYLNDLMRCIRYCANSRYCKLSEETLLNCLKIMTKTLIGCASGGGRKGQACRLDATLTLLALLRQIQIENIPVERWYEYWGEDVIRAIVSCSRASRPELRAAAVRVLAVLAHAATLLMRIINAVPTDSLSQFAVSICCQAKEANVVREAAMDLLLTATARASPHSDVLECDVLTQMQEHDFIENCIEILVDFFQVKEYQENIEPNIPLSVLERRSELEVRYQKSGEVGVCPSTVSLRSRPPPTAALVSSICDVIHNTSIFQNCPVQGWNEKGVYRLLFRCASWSEGTHEDNSKVRASSCRAIIAATSHKCVRTTLAQTNDCIHALLMTVQVLEDDDLTADGITACAQSLLLLSALLAEKSASETVWSAIIERSSLEVFAVILQCLESDEKELQDAALHCLAQFCQSADRRKHADKSKNESSTIFLESIKFPFSKCRNEKDRFGGAGDNRVEECQPDYLMEHFCKCLISRFLILTKEMNNCQSHANDSWTRVCSCLAPLFAISSKARLYGAHRYFPKALLSALQSVRDNLSLHGKPVDVIRNSSSHPVLRTLYWHLTLITTLMTECPTVKDAFAESDIALSLNRLFPWCMMTDQLRYAIVHLLLVFTNDCQKAWSSMSTCVGGRTLIGELCGLMARESALQSRPRSDVLLLMCLNTIRHCLQNQHCRSVFIKSGTLSSISRVRITGNQTALTTWSRLVEVLSRHGDGAAATLASRPALLPPPLRARLLPAVAHAASLHKTSFLQCSELLELLSGTLLAGDTVEMVSATRAVWALAANHHKAKLLLRSAGIVSALQSALQRIQKSNDPMSQRALQLLTYTNTVLQTT